MRFGQHVQPLTYDLRLPDAAQADALHLLEASRSVVNALLVSLWPSLDAFGEAHSGPAWKQVLALTPSPDPHGSRQFRCEAETAGRILRAQASRKLAFQVVLPILSDGFIHPRTDSRPAGKHRQAIKEAILALQQSLGEEDETAFVMLQSVVEQACNYFLVHGTFPATYEAMQAVPVLSVGLLTYAGDDGGELTVWPMTSRPRRPPCGCVFRMRAEGDGGAPPLCCSRCLRPCWSGCERARRRHRPCASWSSATAVE